MDAVKFAAGVKGCQAFRPKPDVWCEEGFSKEVPAVPVGSANHAIRLVYSAQNGLARSGQNPAF